MSDTQTEEKARFVGDGADTVEGPLTIERLCVHIGARLLEDATRENPFPYSELLIQPVDVDPLLEKLLDSKGGKLTITIKPLPKEMKDLLENATVNNNEFSGRG